MLRYDSMLIAYLNSFLHNVEDAEDLMIDCFTVILADKPRIREGCFKAYLLKVAHHKACRFYRQRERRREVTFSAFELMQDGIPAACLQEEKQIAQGIAKQLSPEEALLTKERDDTLKQCLSAIAPQYREALWLVYGNELSYEQAAKALGCTKKKINNLINNGKKALRLQLEKEGIRQHHD